MRRIGLTGQSVYLTHHRHVVNIAKEVYGSEVRIHEIYSIQKEAMRSFLCFRSRAMPRRISFLRMSGWSLAEEYSRSPRMPSSRPSRRNVSAEASVNLGSEPTSTAPQHLRAITHAALQDGPLADFEQVGHCWAAAFVHRTFIHFVLSPLDAQKQPAKPTAKFEASKCCPWVWG